MKKEEIISALLYRMSDPCVEDDDEEIAKCDPITLEEAKHYIEEDRKEDEEIGDDDYCIPEEATPELYMEAFNCRIALAKHNVQVNRLAEWLVENDEIALYNNYRNEYGENNPDVVPIDFMYNYDKVGDFPFGLGDTIGVYDVIELINIGRNSAATFRITDDYFWYDAENKILHSTNHPYADGTIDAKAFADYILKTPDLRQFFFESYPTDKEKKYILYGEE